MSNVSDQVSSKAWATRKLSCVPGIHEFLQRKGWRCFKCRGLFFPKPRCPKIEVQSQSLRRMNNQERLLMCYIWKGNIHGRSLAQWESSITTFRGRGNLRYRQISLLLRVVCQKILLEIFSDGGRQLRTLRKLFRMVAGS